MAQQPSQTWKLVPGYVECISKTPRNQDVAEIFENYFRISTMDTWDQFGLQEPDTVTKDHYQPTSLPETVS